MSAFVPHSLELYVEYRCRIDDIAFGRIPRSELAGLFSSGRLSGILLEHEIAAIMGLRSGTQGASPDLYDPRIGTIQCKTFRGEVNPAAVITRGVNAGRRRIEVPTIWTTKSGYWDRSNRMSSTDHADAEDYFRRYNAFMYIDIGRMEEGLYSFVAVSSQDVMRLKVQYLISEAVIKSLVQRIEVVA